MKWSEHPGDPGERAFSIKNPSCTPSQNPSRRTTHLHAQTSFSVTENDGSTLGRAASLSRFSSWATVVLCAPSSARISCSTTAAGNSQSPENPCLLASPLQASPSPQKAAVMLGPRHCWGTRQQTPKQIPAHTGTKPGTAEEQPFACVPRVDAARSNSGDRQNNARKGGCGKPFSSKIIQQILCGHCGKKQ